MIKLDNVSLVFQGGSVALSNISTTINEGEFVYLVGHSGSGKSSFLKLLYKEYISTKGSIEVAGLDVVQLPKWKTPLLRRKLGIVTQEPQLLEKRNTYENIAFALEVMGTPNDEIESKTNTLLDLVELNGNAFKYPDQLSGGERQRAVIARALASEADLLLLDEPLVGMDRASRSSLLKLLDRFCHEQNKTIVMISHDIGAMLQTAHRLVYLEETIWFDGPPANFPSLEELALMRGIEDVHGACEQCDDDVPSVLEVK